MSNEDDPEEPSFECPYCHCSFKHERSLKKHITWTCKKVPSEGVDPAPRRPAVAPIKVKVDKEVEKEVEMLATVGIYARFRLSQLLGVTNKSTYPILSDYRFPGSSSSEIAALCPTKSTFDALIDILIDARDNHNVHRLP